MAARGETQANVEVSTLVVPAWMLRWRAPELALVLGERAAALAATRRDEADRLRAESLVVFAGNRVGRGVRVADRAIDALKAAEAAGEHETAWLLRVELAACARSVGAPLTGFAAVTPVLEAPDVPAELRASALVQASECLVTVGRGDEPTRALAEADQLYVSDATLDEDTRLLLRGLIRAVQAAQHRRWGDIAAAIGAAREGLDLLSRFSDPSADSGQGLGRLTLELVLALMDANRLLDASEVGSPMLDRPVRAPSASTTGWLRLALATRVHLPAGRVALAREMLREAAASAERHQLDTLLAESLLALAHVHEVSGELADALTNLRAAHAAERRRARAVYAMRARLAAEFSGVHRQPADLHQQLASVLRPVKGMPIVTDGVLSAALKQQLRQWRPVQVRKGDGLMVKRVRRAAEDMTVEGLSAARQHAADRWRMVQPFGEPDDKTPEPVEPPPATPSSDRTVPASGLIASAGAMVSGRRRAARVAAGEIDDDEPNTLADTPAAPEPQTPQSFGSQSFGSQSLGSQSFGSTSFGSQSFTAQPPAAQHQAPRPPATQGSAAQPQPPAAQAPASQFQASRFQASEPPASQPQLSPEQERKRKVEQQLMELQREARRQIEAERQAREEQRAQAQREAQAAEEAARQEAAREEAARQEAARQEAARQEAAREEAARQEAARQEAAREEAARQEAARQEAARQEAVRREEARREAARLEAVRRDVARQEAAHQEVARQAAEREEAARAAAAAREEASSSQPESVLDMLKAQGLRAGGRRRRAAESEPGPEPKPESESPSWRVEPPSGLREDDSTGSHSAPADHPDRPNYFADPASPDMPDHPARSGLSAAFGRPPAAPDFGPHLDEPAYPLQTPASGFPSGHADSDDERKLPDLDFSSLDFGTPRSQRSSASIPSVPEPDVEPEPEPGGKPLPSVPDPIPSVPTPDEIPRSPEPDLLSSTFLSSADVEDDASDVPTVPVRLPRAADQPAPDQTTQPGFGGQSSFGTQSFGTQPTFGTQTSFGAQSGFGTPAGFGGFGAQSGSGDQPDPVAPAAQPGFVADAGSGTDTQPDATPEYDFFAAEPESPAAQASPADAVAEAGLTTAADGEPAGEKTGTEIDGESGVRAGRPSSRRKPSDLSLADLLAEALVAYETGRRSDEEQVDAIDLSVPEWSADAGVTTESAIAPEGSGAEGFGAAGFGAEGFGAERSGAEEEQQPFTADPLFRPGESFGSQPSPAEAPAETGADSFFRPGPPIGVQQDLAAEAFPGAGSYSFGTQPAESEQEKTGPIIPVGTAPDSETTGPIRPVGFGGPAGWTLPGT
ncbi:hypothetical protein SK803_22455 [Lentzea sp. BCCO 10_0856]|uniref:Histone H1-like nucleoprotein HC2 n=1 Tax=Lentzea miocenica TaxID=3095431 RepID=A0ABU4T496_9PSEU|nr:hypothetical protein [Lentzea sp. BCCO 10_0856]MDX8032989.1 hypothetical protein [Lentzea sp. BCCO 10_0856]